jgi:HAD superfamily hydrolase (TIGR01459 family)
MTKIPPILPGAGALLENYDVLFCDIWGVVHDGVRAYEAAGEALVTFRQNGGTVVLLSNAPMPWEAVAALLDDKAVLREAWDAIVTSGDITLDYVAARGWKRVFKVEYDFDTSMFDKMPVEGVSVAQAEAIVCAGMRDHLHETPEAYLPELETAVKRGLEFVCANPDLVVDVGGKLIQCAGTLAQLYESIGGRVYWAGKPHGPAYESALRTAERIRGNSVARSRILAVGDSVRTDMAGAAGFGIDGLLVAGGIHREEILAGGEIDPAALARLLPAQQPHPVAAVAALRL